MTLSPLRPRALPAAGIVILGLVFYLCAPATPPAASGLLQERSQAILGARAPGLGLPSWPAATTWVSYPLAGAQLIAFRFSHAPTPGEYLARTEETWAHLLRGLWSLLAGAVILGAVALARRGSEQAKGAGWLAAGTAGALLLAAPGLAGGVRDLSPAVPAGLLLVLLAGALGLADPRGRVVAAGVAAGCLLAWFPFTWPVLPLAAAALLLNGKRASALVGVLALSLFLGIILEPSHLLQPGGIIARMGAEWARAGGWGGPGGPGLVPFLAVSAALGPVAAFLGLAAAGARSGPGARFHGEHRRSPEPAALLILGSWIALVALPALSGVRSPGSTQMALAPLLAASAGGLIGWLGAQTGPAGFPSRTRIAALFKIGAGVLGLGLLLSALLPRLSLQRSEAVLSRTAEQVGREVQALVGADALWLADRPPPGMPAPETGSAGGPAAHVFVIPRDSRVPARFDYAYWPRWYAGFHWVLLSGARVRENLEQPGARLARRFYREVESHGELVRQWELAEGGKGAAAAGYRLYRIADRGEWHRPLTESELSALSGGPEQTWLLSALGGMYFSLGDLETAALLFQQGTLWDPQAAGLYNNLGAVYLRQGEFESAARSFDQGLRVMPHSFELLFNYARACNERGLYPRAEELLRSALGLRPDFPPAHYEVARAFLGQGKERQGRMALRRYLELDPEGSRHTQARDALAELEKGGTIASLPAGSAADSLPAILSPAGASR